MTESSLNEEQEKYYYLPIISFATYTATNIRKANLTRQKYEMKR